MERKATVQPPVETRRSRRRRGDVALPLSAWVPRLRSGR
jgi:hypothetical protein